MNIIMFIRQKFKIFAPIKKGAICGITKFSDSPAIALINPKMKCSSTLVEMDL